MKRDSVLNSLDFKR